MKCSLRGLLNIKHCLVAVLLLSMIYSNCCCTASVLTHVLTYANIFANVRGATSFKHCYIILHAGVVHLVQSNTKSRSVCIIWIGVYLSDSNLNVIVILDLKRPSTMLGTNVEWMLSQRESSDLGTNMETTFTQCCLNFVSKSVPNIRINIATMFTQHCLNFVSMLADVGHHNDNVILMLGFWLK